MYWLPFSAEMLAVTSLLSPKNAHYRSSNNFWFCIIDYPKAVQQQYTIMHLLAAFLGRNASDSIATMSKTFFSTKCLHILVLNLGFFNCGAKTLTHNWSFVCLYGQKHKWQYCYHLLNMSVNRVSTVFVGSVWATQQLTVFNRSSIELFWSI